MIDVSDANELIGQTLTAEDGSRVGKIGQVYLDDFHGQPEWVTVNTGLFGTSESFVPLAEASRTGEGLSVPYSKDLIKSAPSIDDSGHLSESEEQGLYTHYEIPFTTEGSTFADMSKLDQGEQATGTGTRSADRDERGYDTSGPTTDESMTRSEEHLNVGTQTVQTGKARLRKWVETETVQVDVPVSRERAVLVTEPITDANRDDALAGPAISEEEHEMVLTEQRPVVSIETVPVERVRLDKDVVEATETVSGDVRKERIQLETDDESPSVSGR